MSVNRRMDDLERRLGGQDPPRVVVVWDEEEEAAVLEAARKRGETVINIEWEDPPDHTPGYDLSLRYPPARTNGG